MGQIIIKRIYDPPGPEDGRRYLVDGLWPRGVSQDEAQLDGWLKELAPSESLRHWFDHDPERWPLFRKRYKLELEAAVKKWLLRRLAVEVRDHDLTLLYAARDTERNNAVALKEKLDRLALV